MSYIYKTRFKTFTISMAREAEETYCTSPRQAYPALRAIYEQLELDTSQEHFVIACLNSKGRVSGFKLLSSGTETACPVNPAMIFRAALILGGTSVILCHNHPSGNPAPSREDKLLTDRCRSAGKTLGLTVADHFILGEDCFHSFRAAEGWDNQ